MTIFRLELCKLLDFALRICQLSEKYGQNLFSNIYVQHNKYGNNWGFRQACCVATAVQNLKDFSKSSLWTWSHLMAILRRRNKKPDVLMILA